MFHHIPSQSTAFDKPCIRPMHQSGGKCDFHFFARTMGSGSNRRDISVNLTAIHLRAGDSFYYLYIFILVKELL